MIGTMHMSRASPGPTLGLQGLGYNNHLDASYFGVKSRYVIGGVEPFLSQWSGRL